MFVIVSLIFRPKKLIWDLQKKRLKLNNIKLVRVLIKKDNTRSCKPFLLSCNEGDNPQSVLLLTNNNQYSTPRKHMVGIKHQVRNSRQIVYHMLNGVFAKTSGTGFNMTKKSRKFYFKNHLTYLNTLYYILIHAYIYI